MNKNRRRSYLTEKSLQLRYMGMVGILMLIISIVTGWIIYSTTWVMLLDRIEHKVALDKVFTNLNKVILVKTSTLVFAGICLGAIMTMFVVHRITGPLSRVREIMHEIGKGVIPLRVKFRKGDEFQDIAEAMDRAVTRIEEDTGNNLKVIKEASDCLRRGSEWLNSEKPQVQRLKEELEHLRKCLERFKIFQKQLGE